MKIGQVIMKLNKAERLRRKNWQKDISYIALENLAIKKERINIDYIYLRWECGLVEPWVCSHTDLLADDWVTVKK